jgi:translation initiation factor RLI1
MSSFKRNEIVLIRGVPGSGKTTKAKSMSGYVHLEADMYFDVKGKYVYDPSKIKEAHDWCVAAAAKSLQAGKSVVVSNTFKNVWEMKRYVDLGFSFQVIEMNGSWPNVHGVPENKVEQMKKNMEQLPATWKVTKCN